MSHLQRVASILGTLLLGISAYMIVSDRAARARRAEPPVEELAEELKHAWEGYHSR